MSSLLIGGATSSAGKSLITAAFCRILAKRGYDVAPFKAQNMSLNSFVTKKGKEIAIAQAYQAFAAGIEPDERMNPILLKPKGNFVSQLVVMGEAVGDVDSRNYYRNEIGWLKRVVEEAYTSLAEEYDFVVIEGAGGMAEINLYERDLANIHITRFAKPDIVIVGDIDRGGVFASLFGTYTLLPEDLKTMVKGFVINRLRGREDVLYSGIRKLEMITGVPVLGILPYLEYSFPSEDSLNIEEWDDAGQRPIGIVRLPRVSNFTDFEFIRPFVRFLDLNSEIDECEIVIIPGTKDTIADLKDLKRSRLGEDIIRRAGEIPVIGICGGYQIMGRELVDCGVEHGKVRVRGLGLLDAVTRFEKFEKRTVQVVKRVNGEGVILDRIAGQKVWGYEIHKGITESSRPVFENDGCVSEDGMCWGTYLHGLFWNSNVMKALGNYLGVKIEREDDWVEVIAREVERRLKLEVVFEF
ncbi:MULTISPECIES: cobyric acid synthase CobQ [unclassified Archaeoglobus]|jgi:adenosylcobyric acid synthase|uniref:cobyric acid synthase CobQ n=1 Tax=unclassified Archaeoglobus TaxID=2643606 RepID=UPI0025BE239F|nr:MULTISPECIES: cobyric acid synthase CobQ [unclassified Archaeoglobus]